MLTSLDMACPWILIPFINQFDMKPILLLNQKIMHLALTLAMLFLMAVQSYGQDCSAACAPVNIQFSGSCDDITVTPSQVATALNPDCNYELTFNRLGDPEAPPILTPDDIGTSVMYTLSVPDVGVICMSEINVSADDVDIIVFCPDEPIELSCGVSIPSLPAPGAVSCTGNPVEGIVTNIMTIGDDECVGPFYGEYAVTYLYNDGAGNSATCIVTYRINLTDIDDVEVPADVTLECADDLDLSTDALGVPTIGGIPFTNETSCNLIITAPVDNTGSHGCNTIIQRQWVLNDWCDDDSRVLVQNITIEDTTDPEISLGVDTIQVSALPTQCASGNVVLPAAAVSDDCSETSAITVNMLVPVEGTINVNGTTLNNVPVGEYTIVYTAFDECGNSATAELVLIVSDDTGPNVVCRTSSTVVLNNLGIATVPASAFDNGSSDNCNDVFFKVRRMDGNVCDEDPQFNDVAAFCCADVAEGPLMIILRVYDTDPGAGPISDDDLIEHSNECMVEVIVQDKQVPAVVCPSDVTVDCEFDLDFFLTNDIPETFDNCSDNLSFEVDLDESGLDQCGLGVVVRTITYSDIDNELVCQQNIIVENVDVPNGIEIEWPRNIMLTSCGGNIDPENLPDTSSVPVITVNSCALPAVNYEDMVFDIVDDACFKVVRTWRVMDWCAFEATGGAEGLYTHHQLIKVLDDEAPEIVGLEDVTIALDVDDDCDQTEAFVNLPEITANDCTPIEEMIFQYRIDFGNNGVFNTLFVQGNNASGVFPMGESRIQFRVDDRCGNRTTGEMLVLLEIDDNKKPTPVVKRLHSTLMPGMQMVTISASSFNADSYDNCTAAEDLIFTFSEDINDRNRIFTCDDLDTAFVTIYVWDEAGNFDFSETYITLLDNGGDCPDSGGLVGTVIGGVVYDEHEVVIESVSVDLIYSGRDAVETGQDGQYMFAGVEKNKTYKIKPTKDINPKNGVSTMDVLLIKRHILGLDRLDTPYKLLAADVNRSGTITGSDLVAIQRLILGRTDHLAGNPSWRFMDADYEFIDPDNPFQDNLPELVQINNADAPVLKDFVGIKMGDVNNTASMNSLQQTNSRHNITDLTLVVEDQWIEKDEMIQIPVYADNFEQIMGFQGTISFDPEMIRYKGITSSALRSFKGDMINDHLVDRGIIPFMWYEDEAVSIDADAPLFYIRIQTIKGGYLKDLITIDDSFTDNEYYTERLESGKLNLRYITNSENTAKLFQNKPNPFGQETVVSFYLTETADTQLTIMDLTGKVLWTQTGRYGSGNNDIIINSNQLGGPGVYLYRLDIPGFSDTKRMVLVSN